MILITGSKGWLGQHLCKYFENIYHYDIIDGLDITEFKLPKNINLIIHLAAKPGVRESIKNPNEYWKVNVKGSKQVMRNSIPCIYTSTSAAKEWWLNPYATTKKIAEYFNEIGTNLRLTNLYADTYEGKEDLFGYKFKNNKLEYISKGHSRDFIHIEDVCEVIYKLSKKTLPVKTYDLGSGICLKLKQISPTTPEKEALSYELKTNDCDPTEILTYTGHVLKYNPKDYFNV